MPSQPAVVGSADADEEVGRTVCGQPVLDGGFLPVVVQDHVPLEVRAEQRVEKPDCRRLPLDADGGPPRYPVEPGVLREEQVADGAPP